MSKPAIHARSSAKKFGGVPEDYLPIHNWFDSSKSAIGDNRHRVVTHSSFGIFLAEKTFGMNMKKLNDLKTKYNLPDEAVKDIMAWKDDCINNGTEMINSDGKAVQVRDIGEQHVVEDFAGKFIPSLQDYIACMPLEDWMQNGRGYPASFQVIQQSKLKRAMHE